MNNAAPVARVVRDPPELLIDPAQVIHRPDGSLCVLLDDEALGWLAMSVGDAVKRRLKLPRSSP